MALSYKNDTEQDNRLNPAHKSGSSSDLQQQEQAGYDREFNDIVNNSNLSDLKDLEGDDGGFYRRASAYGGNANSQAATRYMSKENIRAIVKKRGVMGLIVTLLVGGGTAGFLLFSPGMAIVQLKETLTKDLNDQLTAMDRRSVHVFSAKLKSLQAGGSICSGSINIRCKFSSLSGTSVNNFKLAGIELECGAGQPCGTSKLSRNQVTKLTFPDGKSFTNPSEATRYARTNTQAASAMRRAYNPIYRGFSDSPAVKAFNKLRISKQSILTSGDAEENDTRVREAVKNGVETDGRLAIDTPDDEDNKDNREKATQLSGTLADGSSQVAESGVKAASGLLGGAAKSVGIIGIADNACTFYRTSLAIESGAKMVRAAQLARFAMVFLVTADAIKAGEATPEQVEYIGNILTAVDTRKEITVTDASGRSQTIPNPMYNKSAFDSPGYKVAAYNEAPTLTGISQQYTVGGSGGILGAMSAANQSVYDILGSAPQETCNVVQNGFVRVGSLIVGVAVGALSAGSTVVANLAANVAFSIALSFAEQMLIDLLAGTAVDKNTKGAQAGDAIFAGSAVMMGNVAAARGLSPLKLNGVKSYIAAKNETDSLNIAIDKYEAQQTPYDISNKYTFIGSMAHSLNNKILTSRGNILTSIGSLAASPLQFATAGAMPSTFNEERFQQCDDPTYKRLELAADVFCNIRYGMSDMEMGMDTTEVLEYMIANGHIDDTGEPKSETFKKYVLYCTERTNPIGNSGDAEANDAMSNGEVCYDQSPEYQKFRVYLVDKSISEGIDDEPPVAPAAAAPTGPTTNSGNVNAEGWSYPTDTDATVTGPFIAGAHYGQDIAKNGSVPIFAVRDGIVTAAGDISTAPPYQQPCTTLTGGVQQVVVIKHTVGSETYFSSYHHVAAGSFTVRPGATVKAGDKIAMMGNTGCSTGQHLHFEIWKNSIFGGAGINIDPATVLKR